MRLSEAAEEKTKGALAYSKPPENGFQSHFRQVPLVLGNRASGFTLEGVPKNWDEVSARADHIMRVCDSAAPPTSEEIPGDYGT